MQQHCYRNLSAMFLPGIGAPRLTLSPSRHCQIPWSGSVELGWLANQQINLPMAVLDALTSDIFAAP